MKGQVGIEFLLLMGMGIMLGVVILTVVSSMTTHKQEDQALAQLQAFSSSLQQEIILAAEVEDGYSRKLNVPTTINGQSFNITLNQTLNGNGYIVIDATHFQIYYAIPYVNGTMVHGTNYLRKQDGKLYIN